MKNNIGQIITSGLCVVLLVMVVAQGKKIEELSQKLDNKVNNLRYELQNEISNVTNIVKNELEDLDRIILSKELKPTGIDKDKKQLLANAVINLKEWHADTEVILYTTIGTTEVPVEMTSDGNGIFSCNISLPCDIDAQNLVELEALISGGGLTKKESLGTWGDISMLLPLRTDGSGWSGPKYQNGIMSSQFHISMVGQNDVEGIVNNPEFWVYKNGELVQKIKAIEYAEQFYGRKNYSVAAEYEHWNMECESGDNIDIRFRCEDTYGLGYDFLFANWVAVDETYDNTQSAGSSQGSDKPLELYWPE